MDRLNLFSTFFIVCSFLLLGLTVLFTRKLPKTNLLRTALEKALQRRGATEVARMIGLIVLAVVFTTITFMFS
jgi:hypothetical protein